MCVSMLLDLKLITQKEKKIGTGIKISLLLFVTLVYLHVQLTISWM